VSSLITCPRTGAQPRPALARHALDPGEQHPVLRPPGRAPARYAPRRRRAEAEGAQERARRARSRRPRRRPRSGWSRTWARSRPRHLSGRSAVRTHQCENCSGRRAPYPSCCVYCQCHEIRSLLADGLTRLLAPFVGRRTASLLSSCQCAFHACSSGNSVHKCCSCTRTYMGLVRLDFLFSFRSVLLGAGSSMLCPYSFFVS
jgi:hypothetical protein